jgi:PAS domain S-box-containing protein
MRRQLTEQKAELLRRDVSHGEAVKQLRQSEERYRQLVENVSEVIFSADEHGVLTYVSPAVKSLLDYEPPEVVGRQMLQVIHPDDHQRMVQNLNRVLAGETLSNEYRLLTRSGATRWVRTSSRPFLDGGRMTGAFGVVTDVTEEKLASERLQQQNEFLTAVLESLTHPFYVIDADDFTIQVANSVARRAGVTQGVTCYALTHGRSEPCGSPSYRCPVQEIKQTGKPVTVEHIHLDAEGVPRHVEVRGYPLFDDQGRVARVIEYVLDITERKEAQEARDRSERRYRQLLDALQEGIWAIGGDGRTTFVNPRMAEMLGYSMEEMQGRHLFDFMDERGIEIARRNLERRGQGIREQYDSELLTKDGRRVYTVMETSPITDEQGNYAGAVAGVLDISERRAVEQAAFEASVAAETARSREAERRREADRRREIAEGLQGVMAALNSNQPLDQVLALIAEQARRSLAGHTVAIYRLNTTDGTFMRQAAQGLLVEIVGEEPPLPGHQALREAVTARRPVQRSGIASVRQVAPGWSEEEEARLVAPPCAENGLNVLAAPILVKDEVYGGMLFYSPESRTLSSEEVDLASAFCNQVALAIESSRLREQVQQAAVTAERSRLARDLHDSVTQSLFSASLVTEVLPQVWERDPAEAIRSLEQLRRLTRGALAEMRAMLLELRPTALLNSKLDDLVRQLAEALAGRTEGAVTVDVHPVPALPPEVHVTFYRIAQEAMQNAAKHAEADHITVRLGTLPALAPDQTAGDWHGQVRLQVSDDGKGLDPASVRANQLGLRIMRERAEVIGARLTVGARRGQGTQITLAWRSG